MRPDALLKIFVSILLSPFFLSLVAELPQAKPSSFSVFSPDSGGKKPDSAKIKEKSNVPAAWTKHELDSIPPHQRFWLKNVDTTGKSPWQHISRENIAAIYDGTNWVMRDTSLVLRDTGCFKWYGILGSSPEVGDTLILVDTCAVNCWTWVPITFNDCGELPIDTAIWIDTCNPCMTYEVITYSHEDTTGDVCERSYGTYIGYDINIPSDTNRADLGFYGEHYYVSRQEAVSLLGANSVYPPKYKVYYDSGCGKPSIEYFFDMPHIDVFNDPCYNSMYAVTPNDSIYMSPPRLNAWLNTYGVAPTFYALNPPQEPLFPGKTQWVPVSKVDTTYGSKNYSGEGGWLAIGDIWADSLIVRPRLDWGNSYRGVCCDSLVLADVVSFTPYFGGTTHYDSVFYSVPASICDSGTQVITTICDSVRVIVKDTCNGLLNPGSVTNNIFNEYINNYISNYFNNNITNIINNYYDTCGCDHPKPPDTSCYAPREFDLYCVDSLRVTSTRGFTKRICDTSYYTELEVLRDSTFYILYPEDLESFDTQFSSGEDLGSQVICLRRVLNSSGGYSYILDVDVLYGRKPFPTTNPSDTNFICVPFAEVFKWYHFDLSDAEKATFLRHTTSISKVKVGISGIPPTNIEVFADTINCRDTLILERSAKLATSKTVYGTAKVEVDTCNPCMTLVQTSHGVWLADTLIKDVWDYDETSSTPTSVTPDYVWYRPYTYVSKGRAQVLLTPPSQTYAAMLTLKVSMTNDTIFMGASPGTSADSVARSNLYTLLSGVGGVDCRPIRLTKYWDANTRDTLMEFIALARDLQISNDTATCHLTGKNQTDCFCIARDTILKVLGVDSVKLLGEYAFVGPCQFEKVFTSTDSVFVPNCFRDSIIVQYCYPEDPYPAFATVRVPLWEGCSDEVAIPNAFDSTFLYTDTTIVETFVCDSVSYVIKDTCGPCYPAIKASNGIRSIGCDTIEIDTPCPDGPKAYWDGKKLIIPYPCDGSTVTINGVEAKEFEGLATDDRVNFAFNVTQERIKLTEKEVDSLLDVIVTDYRLKADTTKPLGNPTWTQLRTEVEDSLQYYAKLDNILIIDTTHFIKNSESGLEESVQQSIPGGLIIGGFLKLEKISEDTTPDSVLVIENDLVKKAPYTSASWNVSNESASFTATSNTTHFIDASGGDIFITLPSHTAGLVFELKRIDATGNNVTIDDIVDGVGSSTISNLKSYRIMSDGSNWYFLATY